MKNIIFIAPPAAGKGTYSDMLQKKHDYLHISTGDMLREEIASGSDLGLKVKNIIEKGELVTDDIMVNLIENKFKSINGKPFILDGFPRTLKQAECLQDIMASYNLDYAVIYIDIVKETLVQRICGRLTCKCGKSFNMFNPECKPKVEGICDDCGATLVRRDDDNEESFNVRYESFLNNTAPLKEFYQSINKFYSVDGNKPKDEVFDDIEVVAIND